MPITARPTKPTNPMQGQNASTEALSKFIGGAAVNQAGSVAADTKPQMVNVQIPGDQLARIDQLVVAHNAANPFTKISRRGWINAAILEKLESGT